MATIFWAVLLANVASYVLVDTIKDALLTYQRRKRKKQIDEFFEILDQQLEDEYADDEDDEDWEESEKK